MLLLHIRNPAFAGRPRSENIIVAMRRC